MKYQIWIEGWQATGGSSPASFIGEVEAESFREACLTVRYHDKFPFVPIRGQLLSEQKTFREESLTDWGCRLFDNEKDARKSFG